MSTPPATDATKKFRPFRTVAWAVYLLISVGFSMLVIVSVFSSVLAMTPARPKESPDVLSVRQCADGAAAMFEELEQQRKGFTESAGADRRFLEFRTDWLLRERRLEAECALDRADRAELQTLIATLNRLLDQYTTGSVQYAGMLASTVEAFKAQLQQVK